MIVQHRALARNMRLVCIKVKKLMCAACVARARVTLWPAAGGSRRTRSRPYSFRSFWTRPPPPPPRPEVKEEEAIRVSHASPAHGSIARGEGDLINGRGVISLGFFSLPAAALLSAAYSTHTAAEKTALCYYQYSLSFYTRAWRRLFLFLLLFHVPGARLVFPSCCRFYLDFRLRLNKKKKLIIYLPIFKMEVWTPPPPVAAIDARARAAIRFPRDKTFFFF